MKRLLLALAPAFSLLIVAACDQPKPRNPPPAPELATPAAPPAPPADGASTGLAKREQMAVHTLDRINDQPDPYNRPATIKVRAPVMFTGFIFDPVAKQPGKALDLVIDGKAYAATYGKPRTDVAAHFKAPSLTNVGFELTLPADALAPGEHTALLRLVAADGAGYHDSATTRFKVQ